MNDVWACIVGDKKLVVRCEGVMTAYEVRQFAAKKLGADPAYVDLRLSNVEGSAEPTVEVRWDGDDYAHGGDDPAAPAPGTGGRRPGVGRRVKIAQETRRLMDRGAAPSEALRAQQSSQLSNRWRVLREANRRGKWFGIASRAGGGKPIGRAEARLLAADSAAGRDPYQNCAVSPHWRPLFERTFVKSAIFAARTGRSVTACSKYGVA